MSLSFDGVDDLVTGPNYSEGTQITIFAWIYPKSLGEGSLGAITWHGPDPGTTLRSVTDIRATNNYRFTAGYGTTLGHWRTPDNSIVLNIWQSVASIYDWGAPTNAPRLFINGVSQSVTEVIGPSGSANSDGGVLYAGNRSAIDRTFDGFIGEVGWWNRGLLDDEILTIHFLGPLSIPDGLQVYWPMWEATARDFSGNGRHGTVTGAILAENPPLGIRGAIMRAWRQLAMSATITPPTAWMQLMAPRPRIDVETVTIAPPDRQLRRGPHWLVEAQLP